MRHRMHKVCCSLGLLFVASSPFSSQALSCEYYPDSLRHAEDVYIIAPNEVLERNIVLPSARIGGAPPTYDRVMFEVLETLRGPKLTQLELYCASGCGDNHSARFSVFAVAKRRADGQPNSAFACNIGRADDQADPDTKQALDDVRNRIRERPHR